MPDLVVIDAHHHLTDLRRSYPWLEGPAEPFRYHGDDRPLRRSYSVDDYRADACDVTLLASVHVENGAADALAETAWIDALARESTVPTVHVAHVSLLDPEAPRLLEEHAAFSVTRGVRDILNWHPDPVYSHRDRGDVLGDPVWRANFGRLQGLGLSFDLQVFPSQLAEAAALAADFPETAIVLDHLGMPIGRDPESVAEWRAGLAAVAAQENTVVKISALGTNDHSWTRESIAPFVLETLEVFGPDRSMFGSNFPVDGLYSSFTELYSAFDTLTAQLSPPERLAVFAGTADRFYRMGVALPRAE
ncbi:MULTISPECIES: amidohydrolase [unclassified Rathayibacter]|uniref:amidohydrolase family protein n=1 Tax=unclassified Rathayibacter TaxID=2609250 RepID=UPI001FB26B53|nr:MULTISPECIES: amidohydrolase family protein [unclassified Rathayibacter]MCJ1684166.1 amidohydrolase family protein [Rathayibacter sp. VKM Ac-2928]MCJ1686954.1 amidohydrolase family protein [Rathayibacter sp. VKM Ac-2927]